MFVPLSRILTMLMAGVACFGIIVPIALQRHNEALAIGMGLIYLVYLAANLLLWRHMRPRA